MFKWLTAGFILSLGLILTFALTDHLPAPFPIVDSLFNALTNLAYGFSASYLFYIINIYLPQKQQRALVLDALSEYVAKAYFNMNELENVFGIRSGTLANSPDQLMSSLDDIDLDEVKEILIYGAVAHPTNTSAIFAMVYVIHEAARFFELVSTQACNLSPIEKGAIKENQLRIPYQYLHATIEDLNDLAIDLPLDTICYHFLDMCAATDRMYITFSQITEGNLSKTIDDIKGRAKEIAHGNSFLDISSDKTLRFIANLH